MATKTTWWDKNGAAHDGWIKDGQTFVDEAGTARVPVGATVKTNGGTFQMTANGGVPTYATAKNQYEKKSNAAIDAYRAAGKVQEERINSATNAAIAELDRQKGIAQTNFEDANSQAYRSYLSASNPYGAAGEQRARLGLANSGYAESSMLKLSGAYADQLNENLRAMNEQLSALDVQIAQAKASGQYELASIYEAQAQNIMQQQIALQGNLFSSDMQTIGQAESSRQFDEQMAWQKAQADEQKKMNIASIFLEAGANSEYIADTFDIKQEEADALVAKINAQRTASRSSGGNNTPKINTQYLQSLIPEIQKSGLTINEWLKDYGNAMGLDDDHIMALATMYYAGGNNPAKPPSMVQGDNPPKRSPAFVLVDVKIKDMIKKGKFSTEQINAYLNTLPKNALTPGELDYFIDTYRL